MTDEPDDVHYDRLYRDAERPPWEIGGPQPALAEVLDTGYAARACSTSAAAPVSWRSRWPAADTT
ncbi:hypothetical protein V2I01_38970 [Micromonospora sp. BRA006-A]|nr:hypothetical protein [Micromonospora sp. BRA006-A]